MNPVVIKATVDENHRTVLELELPDVSPGEVELEIRFKPQRADEQHEPNSRPWLLAKLKASGVLVEDVDADLDDADVAAYQVMSDEEEEAFERSLGGPRPSEDYVYEDREERF